MSTSPESSSSGSSPSDSSQPTGIPEGWQVAPEAAADSAPVSADQRPRRSGRRQLAGVAVIAVLSIVLFGISTLISGNNRASALTGHPEVLRQGCTWDKSGNYVQNCKVWSKSQNKYVIVQIRASNGSDNGIYLLDGMRAAEDRSAWTTDVQAAKVYDGSTDTTLVMPVGGASSFYTDWDGGAGDKNTTIKQETFLTEELPDFLAANFGVSKNNNAIVGLSMSGGPAVTLAERHPEQFKVVQAMSGYYQTDNPLGAAGVFASQTMVSNYTNGILNMWGAPGSQRWTDNDPSKNVNKLAENGQVLIISSGNGFLTPSEMSKLSQQDQISAIALEILSAVSTVLMQLQAAQSGASVISLPNYGGHTWENWGRALSDGKPHVLDALRNNPPVTQKVQLVSAAGSPDPDGATKATQAALVAAKASPVLASSDLAVASGESSASTSSAESGTSTESGTTSPAAESSTAETSASESPSADDPIAPDTPVEAVAPSAPATSDVPTAPDTRQSLTVIPNSASSSAPTTTPTR
ncbi:alpha/beta hydrolase-fold protein [Gordonia sp. ABSL11-1]|uniref:alpha/beta hydrolase n=1 Tax=Gordonia sp. ABSL11-1 TaxID=3053924 RepID=UPI002572B2D9|nr:alpha/beta hydrolase-fold protein [Gordonia sp. ABSL11-1]MDL9945670.1 alpha/beta hydrolase-fold protein [Gordonia sp. ABSL11-1]